MQTSRFETASITGKGVCFALFCFVSLQFHQYLPSYNFLLFDSIWPSETMIDKYPNPLAIWQCSWNAIWLPGTFSRPFFRLHSPHLVPVSHDSQTLIILNHFGLILLKQDCWVWLLTNRPNNKETLEDYVTKIISSLWLLILKNHFLLSQSCLTIYSPSK